MAKKTKKKAKFGYTKPTVSNMVKLLKIALAVGGGAGISRVLAYLLGKIDKTNQLDDVIAKVLIGALGVVGATAFAKNEMAKHVGLGIAGVQLLSALSQTAENIIPKGDSTVAKSAQAFFGLNGQSGLGNPFANTQIDWSNTRNEIIDVEFENENTNNNIFKPYFEVA